MEIITAYATKNDCYKAARKCTPKGIVVHSTGANNPYLKRYVDAPAEVGTNAYGNHWNNPASVMGRSVCVHSFIGYALNNVVKVANILPYDYCCWGVGSGSKGSYNYDPAYIQFEMCEDDLNNRAYFEIVRDTAIDYCVYLCKKFNIPVENIVSHMLSNNNVELVHELYKGFNITPIAARRSVNRNGNGRTGKEVIITNYLQDEAQAA